MAEPAVKKVGWQVHRFDEMATMVNDRVESPEEADVDHYVGLEHLDPESLKIRRWGSPSDVTATKLRFRQGDIIFGRRRAYQRKLAVADFDGICSAHAMVLRAKPAVVLREFLPFFMQSDLFMERAKEISVGSLSPTINWKILAKQEFALPPLKEQRRLAEVEQEVWQLRDALVKAHSQLGAMIAAIRLRYFDPQRFPPVELSKICVPEGIKIGPFGAQLHQSDYEPHGVPVVMPRNMIGERISSENIARVSESKAQTLSVHRLFPGDIVLPRRGELNRRAYVTEENSGWLCGTGSVRIQLRDGISPLATLHALGSRHSVCWLEGSAVGTTMLNLNTKIVGRVPIALPPAPLLEEVVAAIDAVEGAQRSLAARIEALNQLRMFSLDRLLGGDS